MEHIAHEKIRDGKVEIQTIKEHTEKTKLSAGHFGQNAGLRSFVELAALVHDMGKETSAFWEYIHRVCLTGSHAEKGSVDHATAGAYYIFSKYHNGSKIRRITAEMLAMVTAYHHGGLGDFVDLDCHSEFLKRMAKAPESYGYEEAIHNYFTNCYTEKEIEALFDGAVLEIEAVLRRTGEIRLKDELVVGLLTKFAYSCLIDGDRLDAFCFEKGCPIETFLTGFKDWSTYAKALEARLDSFEMPKGKTERRVMELRMKVAEECLNYSRNPKGIYRLTVPTGGGKTYACFRYALAHAEQIGMDHIIYIAPFLTILDQNVRDMREVFHIGKDDVETLLEFDSNVLSIPVEDEEKQEFLMLASERFEAPFIFTTLVQFLNSFYAAGSGNTRRLHQFSRSVIIFDEVQAVPYRCINLFNTAINFLAEVCGSTIILCTATQPELSKTAKPLMARNQGEMISDTATLFSELKRTEIVDCRKPSGYTIDEMEAFVWEKAEAEGNALVILNKKKQAEQLYRAIKSRNSASEGDLFQIFHLSTHMCPTHRMDVLQKVIDALERGERVICISTQLIEAGVNISFSCVVRAVAGLDSMAQAAGRCNRHGSAGTVKMVYLINPANEDLSKLQEMKWGKEQCERILDSFAGDSEPYDHSLLSPAVMAKYFDYYYQKAKPLMNYPVKGLENTSIMTLLGKNSVGVESYNENNNVPLVLECAQAHRTAAKGFEVIPGGTISVVTDYGKEGKELIAKLSGSCELGEMKRLLKLAQRYSVNLYRWEFEILMKNGGVAPLRDGAVYALVSGFYDDETGIDLEGSSFMGALNV
ncbi:CRISPR-associated helicase Cas3' [Bacilliculturomica massiliensis]|uniref:CRISPR-associated helicase Cas3' n=1 Tax=Bacilliculturomica massiliensis TaxID=1917867 RepID=UPI0010308936|nr:CRISPR-associated helicase Cas3' [Bacilliculturomica massiliensis]